MTFSRLSTLKIHKNIHQGDKPFKCIYKGCNKRFVDKKSMKDHYQKNHDDSDNDVIVFTDKPKISDTNQFDNSQPIEKFLLKLKKELNHTDSYLSYYNTTIPSNQFDNFSMEELNKARYDFKKTIENNDKIINYIMEITQILLENSNSDELNQALNMNKKLICLYKNQTSVSEEEKTNEILNPVGYFLGNSV